MKMVIMMVFVVQVALFAGAHGPNLILPRTQPRPVHSPIPLYREMSDCEHIEFNL